jgi:hypothetical protein
MGPHNIDRRCGNDHSPPPESGDSVDRMDMARRNFENDPADVRAAVPRELSPELARRTICCAGDFGDTASSPGRKRVSRHLCRWTSR